jgi:hypothetical protein
VFISAMSAPATKAFGPAPVNTTTRTSGSAGGGKAIGQRLQGRGVQGVELVRALDGHGADGAVVGDSDQGIGHGETPGTLKK